MSVYNIRNSPIACDIHDAQIHCYRARLTAEASNWVTVVSIAGDIDALNAEPVCEHIRAFVTAGRPLVLDLSEVDFLGVDGIRGLFDVGNACAERGVNWAVIASHAVRRLLRIADGDGQCHAVASMVEVRERLHVAHRPRRLLQVVT